MKLNKYIPVVALVSAVFGVAGCETFNSMTPEQKDALLCMNAQAALNTELAKDKVNEELLGIAKSNVVLLCPAP